MGRNERNGLDPHDSELKGRLSGAHRSAAVIWVVLPGATIVLAFAVFIAA
jgi:hypothetical protein